MIRRGAPPCVALLVALLCAAATARAEVPAQKQALIVMRVLAYDRALEQRSRRRVRIAVVHGPGADSLACASRMRQAFDGLVGRVTVKGKPIGVDTFASDQLTVDLLERRRIGVAYVCRGTDRDLDHMIYLARRADVLTFTDQPGLVERGLAIALTADGGRARISINLEAVRAEGAQLGSHLLNLSRVVRR